MQQGNASGNALGNASGDALTSPHMYASIRLGSSLTLDCYADLSGIASPGVVTVKFIRNGITTVTHGTYDTATGRYVFSYTQINPQCMTDPITIELYNNGKLLESISGFTVMKYCISVYSTLDNHYGSVLNIKRLLANLLIYGRAAQIQAGYRVSDWDISVPEWIENWKYWAGDPRTSYKDITKSTDAGKKFKSVYLKLDNGIDMIYRIACDDPGDVKVKLYKEGGPFSTGFSFVSTTSLSELKKSGGYYELEVPVLASDITTVYKAEIVKGSSVIQTLTYSASSYIYPYDGSIQQSAQRSVQLRKNIL